MQTAFTAPAQFINAPAQLITAPAQPPAPGLVKFETEDLPSAQSRVLLVKPLLQGVY